MSGIYIPGMEMPKSGYKVVYIHSNGGVFEPSNSEYVWTKLATAIPVPDHGRLIDADALEDMQMERCDADDDFRIKERVAGRNRIRKRILEAPTIIAADKQEGE